MFTLLILFLILLKISYQEAADFLKLEDLKATTAEEVLVATERIRRVTWRIGLLGAALVMGLLYLMKVEISSPYSVGVVSWICITSCLNFRAYHVEDMGAQHLRKVLKSD